MIERALTLLPQALSPTRPTLSALLTWIEISSRNTMYSNRKFKKPKKDKKFNWTDYSYNREIMYKKNGQILNNLRDQVEKVLIFISFSYRKRLDLHLLQDTLHIFLDSLSKFHLPSRASSHSFHLQILTIR